MTNKSSQIDQWRGDFGDTYVDRNPVTDEAIQQRERAFSQILGHIEEQPPAAILEAGANVGINLRALKNVTDAELSAIEPNPTARKVLTGDGVIPTENIHDADLSKLPFEDGTFDLVFTSGVLIHVPEAALETAYREMHRVSRGFVLSIEYFSPTPVSIPYRGRDDLLFKRDFGGMWMDLFPDLECVADGFFWKRTTGLDDLNWWLFRKT